MSQGSQAAINSNRMENITDDDIDIRELYMMFWRRRMAILAVIIAGISLAILVISTITPRYMAQATIVFESDSKKKLPQDILLPFSLDSVDAAYIMTELEILKSKKMAKTVIDKLDLHGDPEFSIALKDVGPNKNKPKVSDVDEVKTPQVKPSFKKLNLQESSLGQMELSPSKQVKEPMDPKTAATISLFINALKINAVPGSSLINVNVSSRDPYKAALIANTLVDTYRDQKFTEKFENRRNVMNWLDTRLRATREQVFEAESRIEEFKAANNLAQGRRNLVSIERLEEFEHQLSQKQIDHSNLKTLLEQFDTKSDFDVITDSYAKIINVRTMRDIQTEKRNLETEILQLSKRYGPKHPELISRRTKLSQFKKTIRQERKNLKKALENEVQVSQMHIGDLGQQLEEAKEKSLNDNEALITLRELERDAESSKLVLKTLLETYKRSTGEEDTLDTLGVEILSYASVPYEISYPNKALMFSLSALVSLSLGLILAVIIEKLDIVIRRSEQLINMFNIPFYVSIPTLRRVKGGDYAGYVLSKPASIAAEAVRTLRMSLVGKNADANSGNVVMVNSSLRGEGATTLSIWLARLTTKSGERVILIDANLRYAHIHKELRDDNERNLVEYLSGQIKYEEMLTKDDLTELDIIYGQTIPNSAFDLINAPKMKLLMDKLRVNYDLVVINAPPCMETPDARALCNYADHIVYVVASNQTPKDAVSSGVKYFYEAANKTVGFVMTKVR